MNKLVRNERRKLTATYLNGLAIAVFAVGGLAPVAGLIQGTVGSVAGPATLVIICLLLSGVLHWVALLMLKGMEE